MNYLLYAAAYLWLFWGLYVLVMGLYRAKLDGRLSKPLIIMGAPFLVVAYVMDVLANLTIATVLFQELPQELTVTARLKRHLKKHTDWRFGVAHALCESLLDPLDPTGRHCD